MENVYLLRERMGLLSYGVFNLLSNFGIYHEIKLLRLNNFEIYFLYFYFSLE